MSSQAQLSSKVRLALEGAEEPMLLETEQQLEMASKAWNSSEVLGLDTEFVRERTYRADLGLVQISDGKTAWLIDPVVTHDLNALLSVLRDESITKVIHSGSEDFEVLWYQLNTVPKNVVDSQIACAMLGQSLQLGYHHAVDWLFDVEIDKDQTRSNWLKRPLNSKQLRYAALDVVLLPLVHERLKTELEALGRTEWLKEEVGRMAQSSIREIQPDRAWRRIRGAGALDDLERRILFLLARWREEMAREKNLARNFVVPDAGLLALARKKPANADDLRKLDVLHPKSVDRYGKVWIDLIDSATSIPPLDPLPQLDHRHRSIMKNLKKQVAHTASELNVDAALLASRKQLERFIFRFEADGTVPERFSGWREDVITNDLLRILGQK